MQPDRLEMATRLLAAILSSDAEGPTCKTREEIVFKMVELSFQYADELIRQGSNNGPSQGTVTRDPSIWDRPLRFGGVPRRLGQRGLIKRLKFHC